MKKRILVWMVPTVAVAVALGYIHLTPETPDDQGLARAAVDSRAGAPIDDDRETGTGTVSSEAQPAPDGPSGNCTMVTRYLPSDDGSATEVYTCVPNADDAGHPYERYSNGALAALAYSDAKAAAVLGMRLREDDEEAALSLIFRASALSGGDAEPILEFSNAYPHPSSIDGVAVRKTLHRKFVMSAVADLLGADRNNLGYWEHRVRETSTDPERDIALLRAQAQRIVGEMIEIQLNVIGTSSIGGQSDA